jgi:hypothetical protein
VPAPFPSRLSGRPFTPREAAALGVTARQLDAVRVRRLHHGVRAVLPGEPSLAVQVAAALKVLPADTLISGVTGLQLLGVDVGTTLPLRFCTTHPHQVRRRDVEVRRVKRLPPQHGQRVEPAHCVAGAARDLGLVETVAAGDWLVHAGLATPGEIVAAAACLGGHGSRVARRAAALVRPRVESPRETRLRLVLVLAGLPEPETNSVLTADGVFVGRADLLFRAYRLVVEYDGIQHLMDRRQWESDIQRLERFAAADHPVVRVTAARLAHPRRLVLDVYRSLVARGYTGPAPTFTAEWLACFGA